MSIISFVDTDKAVVYSKYMPVFFREYLLGRGIQLIECNDQEYDYLGSNLLALEPGKCVLIDGCPEIQKKVEDAGVTVYTYEGKELSYRGTGGPTCLTCPLLRVEGALMDERNFLDEIGPEIRELVSGYIQAESFTHSPGEKDAERFFLDYFRGQPYWKNHPELLGSRPIPEDPFDRAAAFAMVRGRDPTRSL